MQSQVSDIPLTSRVSSLCWCGDALVDWTNGPRVFRDGSKHIDATSALAALLKGPSMGWAYRFDAAVQSPSGRYAVIYERLGTKALLIRGKEFVRELNRSYYQAEAYEYPIVLFQGASGRELMAHCPDEYNRIEIDDVETGERLTASKDRKPDDFFHSRLAVSPDGEHLLSAGWVWHPVDSVATWSIADALANPQVLDKSGSLEDECPAEVNSAAFIDGHRVLVSSNPDAIKFVGSSSDTLQPGCIGVYDLKARVV